MKKRLIALLLVFVLLIPAGIASAAAYYRVNTTSLVVRMQPGTSSKVLATYRKDYVCTVSKTENGWSYVSFVNGTTGWVQSKYLSKGSSYSAWVAYDKTELRPKASGSGSNATLAKGTKVTVLSHGSSYDFVKTADFGYGYIINSRLSKKKVKASGSESTSNIATGGGYDAWVLIAGGRTVNLYSSASTSSPKIASYPAATKVYVISHGSKFDKVTVDGNTGWMLTAYLNRSEPAPTVNPDSGSSGNTTYTAYVVTANKKTANIRKGNSQDQAVLTRVPYGAPVLVLQHNSKWDYVQYNGVKGYMDNSFLQLAKPSDAGEIVTADPNATAAPQPTFPYVTTINEVEVNFHKRMGDWSSNVDGVGRLQKGYVVTVLTVNGKWAQVEYNGYKGWIYKKYLTN